MLTQNEIATQQIQSSVTEDISLSTELMDTKPTGFGCSTYYNNNNNFDDNDDWIGEIMTQTNKDKVMDMQQYDGILYD